MLWGREQCVIRTHLTGTQNRNVPALFYFFLLIHTERERETDKGKDRQEEGKKRRRSERGWGASKKVWTPAPLWPVKITQWAFRVSEDEGGRGIRSFSAWQGTAHAWLTLWIPTEPIYMLFLVPLDLILKVCQNQSLCLFQVSLTSVCARVSVHPCMEGITSKCFFLMHRLFRIVHKPHFRFSLGSTAFLSNVFCAACSSRGLIMLGLETQTPPCQRQTL